MRNEELYKGFENIPSRPGRGGTYSYVRWQDVADRMNEVFGTTWSSEVMSQEVVGNDVIIRVKVTVLDTATGAFFKQEGFGGSPNNQGAEAGNAFKAAYSKALKDACKKWGVGLFLEEDAPSATSIIPQGYEGREVATPPPAMTQAPVMSTPLPTPPTMGPPPVVEEVPTFPVDTPPMAATFAEPTPVAPLPSNPVPSSGGMALPPGVSMNMSGQVAVTQEVPTAVPSMPPIPPPANKSLYANEKPMTTKAPTLVVDRLSDVQKAALHSILSIKGVEYETLAAEAFAANGVQKSPVPAPEDLTYQEAVYVVKYGNDKFRRR